MSSGWCDWWSKPMPRPGPRRPQVAIRLDVEKLARLDAVARHLVMSRSDLIRYAIDKVLDPWSKETL